MSFDINNIKGRVPLIDYPWQSEVDRLLEWLNDRESSTKAFCFDLIMSAAYIDATSGLEKAMEGCENLPIGFNAHLGFINLCSPCFINKSIWSFQKAVKPQSGALGKLSSEIVLRFIEKLYPEFTKVISVGGTKQADAVIFHKNGESILAEVKSAPLLTFPFIFDVPESCLGEAHEKLTITSSQLKSSSSAIFIHGAGEIKLGKVGDELWPFKPIVDFITSQSNSLSVQNFVETWLTARDAYAQKDRQNNMFYLANASGGPPKIAKERDNWPKRESISDSKTSAGMDRTDDIKKGIYQSLKIGTTVKNDPSIRTAIVSNLPAYRHGAEYVDPFIKMVWGMEDDFEYAGEDKYLAERNLRRVFDFIITVEGIISSE